MMIGKILKSWRRDEGFSVRDAGKMIGISHSTYSRIENGEKFDAQTLMKLMNWMMTTHTDRRGE